MGQTVHRQTKRYSRHAAGDSAYVHQGAGVKASVLGTAIVLTLGFSALELAVGLYGNSLALVGDAGHMVTDSMSLLFALVANFFSRRGADEDHSFGHGRIEALAAFANGCILVALIVWIVAEALSRLVAPQDVSGGAVMAAAAAGLVVNVAVALSLARDRTNINTRAALVHVMGDLLGSVSAIVAGFVVWMGGPSYIDPLLSLVVAALLVRATVSLLGDSSRVLLDAVPEGVDYMQVGHAIASVPGVTDVHDLHVWTMAPGHSAVAVHVKLAPGVSWGAVLDAIRREMSARFAIEHVTVQPETDPGGGAASASVPTSERKSSPV